MTKGTKNNDASRSTSRKVRLYNESDSSPIGQSNYINQSPGPDHASEPQVKPFQEPIHQEPIYEELSSKERRFKKNKKFEGTQTRPMTSKPNKRKTKERPTTAYDYTNQQQAHLQTSDISEEEDVSEALEYLPKTILNNTYKVKNKKKIIRIKKKNKLANYKQKGIMSGSTQGRNQGISRKKHKTDKDGGKSNTGNDSMTPLRAKLSMSCEGEGGENTSSVLIPLADQDSVFHQKDSETGNVVYDEEQNEKAALIQGIYRKKMEKRKQEEDEKATLIQKQYRQKMQKRKEAQERKEENESATMIQRKYRK